MIIPSSVRSAKPGTWAGCALALLCIGVQAAERALG